MQVHIVTLHTLQVRIYPFKPEVAMPSVNCFCVKKVNEDNGDNGDDRAGHLQMELRTGLIEENSKGHKKSPANPAYW